MKDFIFLVQYVCLISHILENHMHVVDLNASGTMVDRRQTEMDQISAEQR